MRLATPGKAERTPVMSTPVISCCIAMWSVCSSIFGLLVGYITTFTRVAQSARVGERGSSIGKDLINSEDPKHILFCRETAFVAIYALFQG